MAKAKVSIDLDLDVVEEAIKAQTIPEVAAALDRAFDIKLMEHLVQMGGVQEMVRRAISRVANDYVAQAVIEARPRIEECLRKTMRDSPDKLVGALVSMIEGADIELDMSAEFAVKEPEHHYDDYRDC